MLEGESAFGLFKQAAYEMINREVSAEAKASLSQKYQVLCDETALVGVIKQTDKVSGEVKEITVEFGRNKTKP